MAQKAEDEIQDAEIPEEELQHMGKGDDSGEES